MACPDPQADRLAAVAVDEGRPTTWFDQLYSAAVAGEVAMPWDRTEPNALLLAWLDGRPAPGADTPAVVVGCGLGADAALLARTGYRTTAFDVSPTAVAINSMAFRAPR